MDYSIVPDSALGDRRVREPPGRFGQRDRRARGTPTGFEQRDHRERGPLRRLGYRDRRVGGPLKTLRQRESRSDFILERTDLLLCYSYTVYKFNTRLENEVFGPSLY